VKPRWLSRYYLGWLLCVTLASPLWLIAFALDVIVGAIIAVAAHGPAEAMRELRWAWQWEYKTELRAWLRHFTPTQWRFSRSLAVRPAID
jgi:hypothetical protein